MNAAPTAAPGTNGPSGIMDDSDGKERRSPVNAPVRTENAAEMKSDVAIETLQVRPPRAGPTNLGDTATHEVGHRSAAPAGNAPAEIYSNNIGGGLLGVQAGQTGAENYREGGVNDTTHQRSAGIQSPRDPASGQATARSAAPGGQGQQFKEEFTDILVSSAVSPQPGRVGGRQIISGGDTATHERTANQRTVSGNSPQGYQEGGSGGSDMLPRVAEPAPRVPQGELDKATPVLYEKAPSPKQDAQGINSANIGGGLLGAKASAAGTQKERRRSMQHRARARSQK